MNYEKLNQIVRSTAVKNKLAISCSVFPNDVCQRGDRLILLSDSVNVTGHIQTYYPEGSLKSDFQVIDGKLNGTSGFWFENGNQSWQLNYSNSVLQDSVKIWYSSGALRAIGTVQNNGSSIYWKWWDINGKEILIHDDIKTSFYGRAIELEVAYPDFLFTESCGYETNIRIAYSVYKNGYIQWTDFHHQPTLLSFQEAILIELLSEEHIPYFSRSEPYNRSCSNEIWFRLNNE